MTSEETAESTGKKSSPTKKSTQKRTTTKRSDPGTTDGEQRRRAPSAEASPTPTAGRVARLAAAELLELTGKHVEGVVGLERTEDGWVVKVEVVEVQRIPETTDVLAIYEVTTDRRGALQGYRRLRRFTRGVPGEEGHD